MNDATHGTEAWFCDWNAGAPVHPDVLACFLDVERACPANPASVHAPGRRARGVLEDARARIARALGLGPDDVVFTSGGTEAANLAVLGLGGEGLPVLLSPAEHPAVFEPAQRRGLQLWQVDDQGCALVAAPTRPVGLIALVHAQSEVGTLQPVVLAGELAHQLDVPLFVDAAQTLGRVDLQPVLASGAVVALSPHKAGGMRAHGVLAGADLQHRLRASHLGGGQEFGLRPGSQSPALAAANALAIELATRHHRTRAAAMQAVRDAFVRELRATDCDHVLRTPLAHSVPNTLMVQFLHVDGRNLLPALDLAAVHASHGSACSSGAPTPPRILTAMGLDEASARACVRFSFGGVEPLDDVPRIAQHVALVTRRLRKKK